jgi:hypothetical protein
VWGPSSNPASGLVWRPSRPDVGWGALPYFSEFSPSGQLVFNAEFPAGVNTYRAYLLPWNLGGPGSPWQPWGSGSGGDPGWGS